jgi:hypothetical protein
LKISGSTVISVSGAPSSPSKKGAICACHRALTSAVLHRRLGRGEVPGLQIADEQPGLAKEQRVVMPTRLVQRREHLGPDRRAP